MKIEFPCFGSSSRSPVMEGMSDRHLVPTPVHALKIRKELRFLEDLPLEESLKARRVKKLVGTGGNDLYELRITAPSRMAYRLIFMIRKLRYIALHFFLKKDDVYVQEISIAIKRLKEYDYEC
jgi:phage-related protein